MVFATFDIELVLDCDNRTRKTKIGSEITLNIGSPKTGSNIEINISMINHLFTINVNVN